MNEEELKEIKQINTNLENIYIRLDGIEHFIQEIAMYGIIGNEIRESIVAIARSLNKDFDKELKEMEDSPGAKV